MKSQSSKRQLGSRSIPDGLYVEPYTPIAGQIISPSLGVTIAYSKVWLNADATCNLKDSRGNAVTGIALLKGFVPFLVSELSSTGGITCYIVHDGLVDGEVKDMTADLYQVLSRNG